MKKHALILSLLVFSLAAAGCSKKAEETAAATEAEAVVEETTAEETSEAEEPDEDSISGSISAMDGDIITVIVSGSNEELNFDIADAEVIKQFDLTEGDYVYVEYYVEEKDPLTAISFEVEESVLAETMDPSVEGKIVDAGNDSITLEVDGEDWTFATGNAYIVADNGITVDQDAVITYIGDLDDEPMAVKVVMADSADSDAAEANAFIGKIAEINEEEGYIILISDNEDFFTFSSGDDLEPYSEGQTVQIFYDGPITAKEIDALKIVVK